MKKILTFAIALVMVFALASTALAAGWDIVVEEKEVEDIKISIEALSLKKQESGEFYYGGKGYVVIETYPVVLEDRIHAVVAIEFPEKAKLSDDMVEYITNKQLKLEIAGVNCEFIASKCDVPGGSVVADDSITKTFQDSIFGKTVYFDVFAEVTKAKADAKIVATLGVYNEWKDGWFEFEVDGEDYQVKHYDNWFRVHTDDGYVKFFVEGAAVDADEDSKIDVTKSIIVSDGTDEYPVSKQVDNTELAFGPACDMVTPTSDKELYNDLKDILEEVLEVLGFTYEGVKYMSEEHFVEYFGTIMETEVSKVWPSGYVVDLDTVDPSILPPQTGDNTSIVGFAMIVVALVAAVVLKKVRA